MTSIATRLFRSVMAPSSSLRYLSNAANTVASSSSIQAANNGGTRQQSSSTMTEKWCSINGFSKFSSRKDLELCLMDVRPTLIDPILGNNMFPTGKWAVLMPDSDSCERLKAQLKGRNFRIYLNILRDNQIDNLRTASKYGITNRSVLLRNVHKDVRADELRYFLRDYAISVDNNAIEMLPISSRLTKSTLPPKFVHYMVRFETASEAERMVQEKCFSVFEGYQIQAHWYHC